MASQAYKILIKAKDQASGTFKKVGGAAKAAGGALAGVAKVATGVTLGLAAVATTLAVLAKKSFDFADAIGKVSTRTGIATDTIQGFQIASVLAGSTVDAANTSLEKFTRSVGDAVRGLKTQADIFRDLGVEIRDVNGDVKDQDTLLREVTQAMSGLTSQSEKATVAANLFGRAGIKILGAIDGLGMGLDDFIETAEEYGLILDQDSIKKSELFNDTLYVLMRQFQIFKAELAIAFLPILQQLAASFVQVNKDTTSAEGGVKAFAEKLRDNLLNGLLNALKALRTFIEGVVSTRSYFNTLSLQLQNIGTSFNLVGAAVEYASAVLSGNMNAAMIAAAKYGTILETGFIDVTAASKEFLEANEDAGSSLDPLIIGLENLITNLDVTDPATQELVNNLLSVRDVLDQNEEGLKNNLDAWERLTATFSTAEERQKQWKTIWVKTFEDAANALTDFVETGKLNFSDLVRSMLRDIARLMIRMQLAQIFGMTGDASSTPKNVEDYYTSGGAGDLYSTGLPTGFGGGYTGMGARAGGLDGKGGFLAMLHPNETVVDHAQGQGGIVINQTVNFATGVQDTVKSEVLQLLPDIAESSKGAVLEAMGRGGAFRRVMQK